MRFSPAAMNANRLQEEPHSTHAIAKQRNGSVGTVNLVYLHSQTKFENRAEDTGEMEE